jgi:hypothetical protein
MGLRRNSTDEDRGSRLVADVSKVRLLTVPVPRLRPFLKLLQAVIAAAAAAADQKLMTCSSDTEVLINTCVLCSSDDEVLDWIGVLP